MKFVYAASAMVGLTSAGCPELLFGSCIEYEDENCTYLNPGTWSRKNW